MLFQSPIAQRPFLSHKVLPLLTLVTPLGAPSLNKTFIVSLHSSISSIDNPATRVGFQGGSGEADGYSRNSAVKVTGDIVFKADATAQAYLESKWQGNVTVPIVIEKDATFSINIPSANISAYAMDMADDGVFINCSWTATLGEDDVSALAVIKMTE